jgi:hypothetical protein
MNKSIAVVLNIDLGLGSFRVSEQPTARNNNHNSREYFDMQKKLKWGGEWRVGSHFEGGYHQTLVLCIKYTRIRE